MRTPLASLAVLLALAFPAGALASVSVTSFSLTPSTTQAGAHPDVTINTTFSLSPTSDDVKSVGVVLPQGLVGDPNAADRCAAAAFAADTCPASSKVGTTVANVTAVIVPGLVETPQQVNGDVYNLQARGIEPARLGVVLRPSLGGVLPLDKVFLQSGVTTGPQTNYGLATTFDGLPRSSGGIETRVDSMKLVLAGHAARGAFMTNPTDCRPARSTAAVTSYDQPATARTASSSFTPTGCASLPFSPRVSGSIGGQGQTSRGISPTLSAIVSTSRGDANPASVTVSLPPSVAANLTQTGRECLYPTFAAGGCPAAARVGSASASSPLLPRPLTAPVIFTSSPGNGQPALGVRFGQPVPLTLIGAIQLTRPLRNTFAGIPDLPLSRFALTIDGGGKTGLLANVANLCEAGSDLTLKGDLVAHSGRTASVSSSLAPSGCESVVAGGKRGRPRARLTLRFKHRRGTLTARFSSPTKLKRVRLTLPKSLRKPHKRGLRVKAGKGRVRGRTLTISTRKRAVSLRWKNLRPTRKLARRLKKHPRMVFVARIAQASGKTTKLRLGVRPSVR